LLSLRIIARRNSLWRSSRRKVCDQHGEQEDPDEKADLKILVRLSNGAAGFGFV
jgi:hypothetical protein